MSGLFHIFNVRTFIWRRGAVVYLLRPKARAHLPSKTLTGSDRSLAFTWCVHWLSLDRLHALYLTSPPRRPCLIRVDLALLLLVIRMKCARSRLRRPQIF